MKDLKPDTVSFIMPEQSLSALEISDTFIRNKKCNEYVLSAFISKNELLNISMIFIPG